MIDAGKISWKIFLSLVLWLPAGLVSAQSLASPSATFSEQTAYPIFTGKDNIYYFCGASANPNGSLTATSGGAQVTFGWEKFNSNTGTFSYYSNDTGINSVLTGLGDGCYRVNFRDNGIDYQFRAWVKNGWITPTASISDSNCEYFNLNGTVISADYSYSDLSTNQLIPQDPAYKYIWESENKLIATVKNPIIQPPPPKNTDYYFQVTDRSGCMDRTKITYESIVAEAKFSWKTNQPPVAQFTNPEAPLDVQFVNESINGDVDKYEWTLFKEKSEIEKQGTDGAEVDSVMEQIYLENPTYTYNRTGSYMVKLVAAKESPGYTCRDTFYLKDYIVIDTSLVKVAPAFTPNGDGINDILIIRTRSLEYLDFQIFNRWGRNVHHFHKSGFIPADAPLATWDGKTNNKIASPGVYFYVVDAAGRDGKRRRKKGFIELIW